MPWDGEGIQRRVALGGHILADQSDQRFGREAVRGLETLDRGGIDATAAGAQPLPVGDDIERQPVERANRRGEIHGRSVTDAHVGEIDHFSEPPLHGDPRKAAMRVELHEVRRVVLLEQRRADQDLLLRPQIELRVQILRADGEDARRDAAEQRVVVLIALVVEVDVGADETKLRVLRKESQGRAAVRFAITDLRNESEVRPEVVAEIASLDVPVVFGLQMIPVDDHGV